MGYAVILPAVVGCIREWLAAGTVFGLPVTANTILLPLASMPAGGFILLGVLCAVWRAAGGPGTRRSSPMRRATKVIVNHQKEQKEAGGEL